MSGKPRNMVPIVAGTFDRATGALRLEGEAKAPDDGALIPYLVDGMLYDGEITGVDHLNTDWNGVWDVRASIGAAGPGKGANAA